jgi:anti-anti-sigma factor
MSDGRQLFIVKREGPILQLAGELDVTTVADLQAALSVHNGAGRALTLDVSELTFIDGSGLHAIGDYLEVGDEPVTLTGASAHVLRLLEITRLIEHPNLRCDGQS